MDALLGTLAVVSRVVRFAVLGGVGVLAVVAALSWAARSRRLNPFGGVARFMRARVDPKLVPIERRLLSSGLRAANAPWWALLGAVIGGLLLIAFVDFLTQQTVRAYGASSAGPRGLLVLAIGWGFGILRLALLVRVISSWVRGSPYSWWARWSNALTEWMLAPLRRIIPNLGMIDITPLIAYFALGLLEGFVVRSLLR
jgi:YggT family protein